MPEPKEKTPTQKALAYVERMEREGKMSGRDKAEFWEIWNALIEAGVQNTLKAANSASAFGGKRPPRREEWE